MKIRSVRLVRGLAAAGVTAGLVLGAAACNDDNSATSAAGSTTAPANAAPTAAPSAAQTGKSGGSGSTTGGSTTTGGSSGSSKPTGATAAGSRCHTGELKADVQLQPMFPGQAMVMLVNKGSRTCTVNGYLGYGGLGADGSQADLGTKRVPYPGPPVQVTLKPGETAFSGLKWSACDKSDASCKVVTGLVVTPPDETTQVTANVLDDNGKPLQQLTVSAAGMTVGSLQPSNEGVVFGSSAG